LKEYLNRWYIVGLLNNSDNLRIFGIDRMQFLKVTNETFIYNTNLNIEDKFEDIIGLNYNENKLETIELSFTKAHADYVKSFPWHKSQTISLENNNELRIKLKIRPNFELKQKILMLGSMIKVINPKYLADEIRLELSKSFKQY
jgi:predicted DNA-binding transcriptional regulator YafY